MNAFLNNGEQSASSNSTDYFLNSKTSSRVEDSSKLISLTDGESITSSPFQLFDVTWIDMYDNETVSGSIASYGYNSYTVPEGIFYLQHNRRHWVHKMYRKLKNPLKSGTITKENICILCCHSLDDKPIDAHAWKKFLRSSALDNMKKCINKNVS